MIYADYDALRDEYLETQRKYKEIVSEKEALFSMTQPQAIRYDREPVSGGKLTNPYDEYLIQKDRERIDERLDEIKSILDERERLLRIKAAELKESALIDDKVYQMYYVERVRVYKIASKLHYSEMQIYRILKRINTNLNDVRKC